MVSIGGVKIRGRLVLAPMAGVTDFAFRIVCRQQGAALAYTEMVSAKALVYKDAKTKSLLMRDENDAPLCAQIFGSEPDTMAEAAVLAAGISGCEILDINMGCPTGKIVKNGDGSALMRNPQLCGRIIEAVCGAVSIPVTVKMRKGWDKSESNAVMLAVIAEEAGAAAITVHGRTRAQLYSGQADWDIIAKVKQAVKIPVIANGDVFEPEDAVRILCHTGADLVMIGRGAMGNPWLFRRAEAAVNGEGILPLPPLSVRLDTAMRQFRLAAERKGEKIACLEARKHYAWYLRGVAHASYFKNKIAKAETLGELADITEGIKRELR
ncbi:MAG: tRNA dihydrouridine synthase DusB [Clostridiales bacterium]|nr:tRNA dihydrouridine synthase DusB [Clostridiales bacterium]